MVLTFCHKLDSLCVAIKSSGTVLNLGLLHEALKVFPRLSNGFDFTKLSISTAIPRHAFTHTSSFCGAGLESLGDFCLYNTLMLDLMLSAFMLTNLLHLDILWKKLTANQYLCGKWE